VQAILDYQSTCKSTRYAYPVAVRVLGLVALMVGVLVAAGVAAAVMLIKFPVSLITSR
jgi:hypothetical protein